MSDLRDAARQALEALESTQLYCAHEHYPRRRVADAITALRAALEQPEQEPVAWMTPGKDIITCNGAATRFNDWTPLYTHPPRREWRGLTEEEIDAVWEDAQVFNTHYDIARAVEAALKERNA